MRFLLLCVLALFVVVGGAGCGKNPVSIQKQYFFSGETLFKVHFKDLAIQKEQFGIDGGTGNNMYTIIYHCQLPSDFDRSYLLHLPDNNNTVFNNTPVGGRNPYAYPVVYLNTKGFLSQTDTVLYRCNVYLNAYTTYFKVSAYAVTSRPLSDSVAIRADIKKIMDGSWMTYIIQKPVDVDSL